jgi:hypothetical protein
MLGSFHGVRGTSRNGGYDRRWQTLPIVPPPTPIDRAWFGADRAAPPGFLLVRGRAGALESQ